MNNFSLKQIFLILLGYSVIIFGVCLISGHELSIHEAVLPQTSRTMNLDHDFIAPKIASSPWLESPPLPQWITTFLSKLSGGCDTLFEARVGSVLMGLITVFLCSFMTYILFGQQYVFLSGFILTTCWQLARYSWLAEDEIYLCAIVTLTVTAFVYEEFRAKHSKKMTIKNTLFGKRNLSTVVFFIALGLTNLVKGLLFGTAMSLIPCFFYLLFSGRWKRALNYTWIWGWLIFLIISLFWPFLCWLKYPDVVDVWIYDLGGRLNSTYTDINEPVWYYASVLTWIIAPWTFMVPFGLYKTAYKAFQVKHSGEKFIWTWAFMVPVVFSIPGGKHHHYLIHAIVPWAMISAHGVFFVHESYQKLLKRYPQIQYLPVIIFIVMLCLTFPFHHHLKASKTLQVSAPFIISAVIGLIIYIISIKSRTKALYSMMTLLGIIFLTGHVAHKGTHHYDARFLRSINQKKYEDLPLCINLSMSAHKGFHALFYSRSDAIGLHNLSYLIQSQITSNSVYLLGQYKDRHIVSRYADCEMIVQSQKSGRETSIEDRLTLFKCTLYPTIKKVDANQFPVGPMQAMYREEGPFLDQGFKQ